MLEKGLTNEIKLTVTDDKTAAALGSGLLEVFATPAMIAAMENACAECVQPHLDMGQTTVGTLVNIRHTRASGKGAEITVRSRLEEIDRRRLVFSVSAYDEKGLIGDGQHERFIIDTEKFLAKLI